MNKKILKKLDKIIGIPFFVILFIYIFVRGDLVEKVISRPLLLLASLVAIVMFLLGYFLYKKFNLSKKKMKLWEKVALGFVVVAVLLIFVTLGSLYVLINLYPNDSALIDNSHILLQPVLVPEEDNGFYDLISITDEIIFRPEDNRNFSIQYLNFVNPPEWDQELLGQVLQKNEQVLDLFDKAAGKKSFQLPEYADPANLGPTTKVYAMNPWREAARLQVIRALSLMYQGQLDVALAEAVKLNKLGHNMITGHNGLIGTLVGIHMQSLGSELVLRILSQGNPSGQALQASAQIIKASSNNVEGYKDTLRTEYTGYMNTIDQLNQEVEGMLKNEAPIESNSLQYENLATNSYFYKPNQTKNLYTSLHSAYVADIGENCRLSELVQQQLNEIDAIANKNLIFLLFQENLVGKLLFSLNANIYEPLLRRSCETDLLNNIAQIKLALKQYHMYNNSLPLSLENLVPQYFAEVPIDPFSRQPINYSIENKTLYSVGVGMKDLGGSTGADWRQMDNPTFEIDF